LLRATQRGAHLAGQSAALGRLQLLQERRDPVLQALHFYGHREGGGGATEIAVQRNG